MQVRDLVPVADDPALGRLRLAPRGRLETAFGRRAVLEDAVARLLRQVQTRAVLLELLGDPNALLVVPESIGQEAREQLLADVTERRVSDVVSKGHRLDEVLVQPQRARERATDLVHLEDVREPRAVVIADRREEDLRLVLRAPERLAVDDAVSVDGERGARRRRLVRRIASTFGALRRIRRERRALELFGTLADAK